MNRTEAKTILENISAIPELGATERTKVEELLKMPGFPLLLGVLLAEKYGWMEQAKNFSFANFGEPISAAQRLGVIQGYVGGIDRIREVILECVTVPTDEQRK